MAITLTDTHCHLDFEPLSSYRDFVFRSCAAKGVTRFLVPATDVNNWGAIQSLAESVPAVYYALGLHPAYCGVHIDAHLDLLDAALTASNSKLVALGEAGLDRRFDQAHFQQALFEAQLALASKHRLPMIIHSLGRHQQVAKLLASSSGVRGVVHAFSGGYQEAKLLVDQGLLLGVGSVICRGSKKTRDAISRLPVDALLLETDAPDMYLPRSKSRIGTPLDCLAILEELADLLAMDRLDLAEKLERNCELLFFEG